MMNLHEAIEIYIDELQELLKVTDEQALLDKACEQWDRDDPRYEVLEQLVGLMRKFNKPAKPLGPESQSGSGNDPTNKPVK
jgi:hypothetical protein